MNFFCTTDTTDTTDTTIWKPGLKLYLSYEFFSYDRHDRCDRYNDMETRLKDNGIFHRFDRSCNFISLFDINVLV